ncbi:MAG: hypothetical protein ACRCX2_30990 [Paraclostridium sp.]
MCKKTTIQEEIRVLSRKLSKTKTIAKNEGKDHMRYQPYLDVFMQIKKKKKELSQIELNAYKNLSEKMINNNFNGRTQYAKKY